MFKFRKSCNCSKDIVPFANNIVNIGTNQVTIFENQNIEIVVEGQNNHISVGQRKGSLSGRVGIYIYGDNNVINIGRDNIIGGLVMIIGQNHYNHGKCNDVHVSIGDNNSFGNIEIDTFNCHAVISVGDECMFSSGITLYHSDGHPIMDYETGKIINKVKEMRIGNHCWVGKNVTILKNSILADNTIVGYGAVVSGALTDEYTAIAGNPAKVIKHGVKWAERADGYIENEIEIL